MTRPRTFDYDRARQMLADGHTLEGVMRELGCTRGALSSARRRMGLTVRFQRGPKPCDDERVEWFTKQGWSRPRIAEAMGISVRTVERSRTRINKTNCRNLLK